MTGRVWASWAAAVLSVAVVVGAVFATRPVTVVRYVPGPVRTVVVTVTKSVSPRPVSPPAPRVVTRTVTRDVPGPAGIPCAVLPSGTLLPFPSGALGSATGETCTVSEVPPASNGEWVATAPGGQTATFTIGP